jgi:hypothetical protein
MSFNFNSFLHVTHICSKPLEKGRGKGRCVMNDIAIIIASIIANITLLVQGQNKIK